MTTGQKITALRRAANLSQETLADRLKVSRQAVSKWEADQTMPTTDNLAELARLFGVPADEILRPEQPPVAPPDRPAQTGDEKAEPEHAHRRPCRGLWLLAAAVVGLAGWNICQQVWLARLQAQLAALPTPQIIYQNDGAAAPADSDLLDHQVQVESYDPKADAVTLTVRAVPKDWTENTRARFVVQGQAAGGADVEAVMENGVCAAQMTVPLAPEQSLYLQVEDETGSHMLKLEDLSGLYGTYHLRVGFDNAHGIEENASSATVRQADGVLDATGELITWVQAGRGEDDALVTAPVSGTITLFADGTQVGIFWVENVLPQDFVTLPGGGYAETSYYYTPFTVELPAKTQKLTAQVDFVDTNGNTQTAQTLLWQAEE